VRQLRCLVGHSILMVPLMFTCSGCSNTLVFGTATKFGVDISQRPDQLIEVTMGYDRYEVVSIPAQDKDAQEQEDTYSVLGIFAVSYGNPWTMEPLILRQFFATGRAAQQAAANPSLQRYFGRKTGEIILEAEREIKRQQGREGAR
jgi:hypothetical protein